jgi:hypothetical protein
MKNPFIFVVVLFTAISFLTLTGCPTTEDPVNTQEPPETPEIPFFPSLPAAPRTPTVKARGDLIKVSWDAVEGASGYDVYYNDTGTAPAGEVTVQESTGPAVDLEDLTGGTYYVWVRARNAEGASPWSEAAIAVANYVFDYVDTASENLKDWLALQPVNTQATPYPVALRYVNVGGELKGGTQANDILGKLFDALGGRYVTLDMSACAGTAIPNMTTSSYGNTRQNKDKIVSLILPDTLETIGNYVFYWA